MANYIIDGGKPLSGTISVGSGKNAAVAILSACLMIRGGSVVLKKVARIEEVERMLEILASVGVKVVWQNVSTLKLDIPKKLKLTTIDRAACEAMRASLLLFGALARHEKQYKLYKTNGCKLGKRTIRPHVLALEKFGLRIASKNQWYTVTNGPLKAADVVMYESGDTTTENAIMAAVLAKGVTTIKFASANYMVQELCHFLVQAGASIAGIGTTTLTITGVAKLKSVSEYVLSPDPVDAMAFIALAITTASRVTIKNCALDFLELELEKLSVMGQKYKIKQKRRAPNGLFTLADIEIIPSKLTALPEKIYGRPFPGLNIDNLPFFAPIATQAKGQTMIHDWPYENRAIYNLEFQKLGAKVILLDPHRAIIEGPTKLHGNELVCPPAIRPAMSLLVAMIAAEGRSVLRQVYPIERAYEDIIGRLRSVGVAITRIE